MNYKTLKKHNLPNLTLEKKFLKMNNPIIFKQSDIHECSPDFKLLNEKRKELMLEGHNIYPYIGSYKAILNAIKFFGYDNLNIVEYWRNVDVYDIDYNKKVIVIGNEANGVSKEVLEMADKKVKIPMLRKN